MKHRPNRKSKRQRAEAPVQTVSVPPFEGAITMAETTVAAAIEELKTSNPTLAARAEKVMAKYPTLVRILTPIVTRVCGNEVGSWIEVITLVLEFLGPMLDKCFNSAEAFEAAARDPGWFQILRVERTICKALRNSGNPGTARERVGYAMRITDEGCEALSMASSEDLATCFAEIK